MFKELTHRVVSASDSGIITAGDENSTKFGVRVGVVPPRRSATLHGDARWSDLQICFTLPRHAIPVSGRQRYFRRPATLRCVALRVPTKSVCLSVCVCAQISLQGVS